MWTYAVIIITSVLVGFACMAIAKQKGKDPVKWFIAGVFLNVLALVIILFSKRKT